MSETITDMVQQSASRVAKAINNSLRISSPTRALMMQRREIVETGYDKLRIEYAEVLCKTIKLSLNKSEDGSGLGQGMSAGFEITDGH